MKTNFAVILVVILGFGFLACQNSDIIKHSSEIRQAN